MSIRCCRTRAHCRRRSAMLLDQHRLQRTTHNDEHRHSTQWCGFASHDASACSAIGRWTRRSTARHHQCTARRRSSPSRSHDPQWLKMTEPPTWCRSPLCKFVLWVGSLYADFLASKKANDQQHGRAVREPLSALAHITCHYERVLSVCAACAARLRCAAPSCCRRPRHTAAGVDPCRKRRQPGASIIRVQ